ncbi:MAG TPA: sugar phosphate nucleotidyltransferase [Pyrinomonadaceae bacterium]|nr:sugar phosphate nucleotidyltransferase [Pyrinomonadaceae bacterium]
MNPCSNQKFRPGNHVPPKDTDRWAIILAGGDGTRLRSLTRSISGDERPKQFCPILGGRTLLDQTRSRVTTLVAPARTMFVLTEKHQPFYEPLLSGVSPNLLLVQPENKGTAPAIVYALTRLAKHSPRAMVALFPSDHYLADDQTFMAHVKTAFAATTVRPETITLLGITPESPEVEYGWIEPYSSLLGSLPRAITRVRRFWEKPSPPLANELMTRGCLWNSFVMVGRVDAFLSMSRRALPEICQMFAGIASAFETAGESKELRELYSKIPSINFSQDVLAIRPEDLAVMKVDQVGWSDLGEPSRVLTTLARLGAQAEWAMTTA